MEGARAHRGAPGTAPPRWVRRNDGAYDVAQDRPIARERASRALAFSAPTKLAPLVSSRRPRSSPRPGHARHDLAPRGAAHAPVAALGAPARRGRDRRAVLPRAPAAPGRA